MTMDAGVFAVAAANRSLLHSLDFNKDETPAALCIHRLLPLLPFVRRLSTFITNTLIS